MAETLTLHFPDFVRVAGEVLQGHVDVNVPKALEDKLENVHVKLRGSIVTKITETEHKASPDGGVGHNETHYQRQTVEVLRLNQTIWDQFNTPQGAQIIACPFQIQLPPNLPPSFYYSHFNRTVVISYSLEVVGARHGLFHSNRRIRKIFSVVPPATPWELNASAALKQGWGGPWKPIATNKEIRHHIFGEHAQVKAELVLPDLPSFPMVTGIPFSFHVLTKTKKVDRDDLEDKHGKLFPAPPTSPADVELILHRRGRMRVHHKSEPMEDKFELTGSLGDKAAVNRVRMTVDQPEWIHTPDQKEDKGSWKRAVHFDGMLSIPFVPTFTTETAEWHYFLRFKVDFPGIGNDLELEFPVQVNSGAACPPLPPNGYHTNVPYAYPLPSGPPPMMILPPSYWNGENHEWDEEK
ncbi:hypothetical protein DFH09DRAFT_1307458 [Mycena vulgaris]|nr:hypothetical protein DFH09DRAFT_1307458 [Mycena vulgaris]